MSKVSIIGAGEVGASCATCLAERDFVNEISMVDVKPGVAEGKALDLLQSSALKRFDTIVKGFTDDYSAISNSDVVVITSGIARKPGMERSDLISTNAAIVQDVSRKIAHYSPNSILVVVSNPLDVMCYCAMKGSGFTSNRVMGMSGLLDVARYKSFIAAALNVSTKDIQALILGGHGKSMVPMPHLGRSGWFAAGAAVCEMVESVICDQRRVFPACAYLQGEYGYSDIYLGVPVIIGKNGVERIIELELDADDRVRFDVSCKEVQKTLDLLNKK